MARKRFKDQSSPFERAGMANGKPQKYVLRLYITGATPRSSRAILNLKLLCEEHLGGRYSLEVVDIYQQPERAREGQVVASPTLVKHLPPPLRRFIGDMSDSDKILLGLDLKPADTDDKPNTNKAFDGETEQ